MKKDRPPVDCPHQKSLFRPCKFEPRYDGVEPGVSLLKVLTMNSNPQPQAVRYCRDVCIRCGRTVERDDE